MTDALRAALEADLASWAFASPPGASLTPRRVGAEVELIPVDAGSGRRCGLEPGATPGTLPFLRRFGSRQGWREVTTAKGTPSFELPAGGTLTFEPGGQLEAGELHAGPGQRDGQRVALPGCERRRNAVNRDAAGGRSFFMWMLRLRSWLAAAQS